MSTRPSRVAWSVVATLMLVQALVLHLMGRVWICSCGTIHLWVGPGR